MISEWRRRHDPAELNRAATAVKRARRIDCLLAIEVLMITVGLRQRPARIARMNDLHHVPNSYGVENPSVLQAGWRQTLDSEPDPSEAG